MNYQLHLEINTLVEKLVKLIDIIRHMPTMTG
jgi:hypothetical protein